MIRLMVFTRWYMDQSPLGRHVISICLGETVRDLSTGGKDAGIVSFAKLNFSFNFRTTLLPSMPPAFHLLMPTLALEAPLLLSFSYEVNWGGKEDASMSLIQITCKFTNDPAP
jgi:hypothetical protein